MLFNDLGINALRLLDLVPITGKMEQTFEMFQEQLEDMSEDSLTDAITKLTCYGILDGKGRGESTLYWFDMDNEIVKKYVELSRLVWVESNRQQVFSETFVELQ